MRQDAFWNLGYRFAPEAQGRGFATGLARAAVDAARERRPELPVVAYLLENTPASAAVARKVGLALRHRGPTPATRSVGPAPGVRGPRAERGGARRDHAVRTAQEAATEATSGSTSSSSTASAVGVGSGRRRPQATVARHSTHTAATITRPPV